MTKAEVQVILDNADVNNDGKLDYSEVRNCCEQYCDDLNYMKNK